MKTPLQDEDHTESRLSDRIHQILLGRILSGQMKSGDIVAEKKLALELGVSRTPVHDALRDLIKDGFLNQEKNRRPVVASFTAEDVYDIFEIRILLEGEACFRAASRMDRLTLDDLRKQADILLSTQKDHNWLELWAQFDDKFHHSIAKASGSKRLLQDIIKHRLSHRALNIQAESPYSFSNSLQEHIVILNALDLRDAQSAKLSMQNHIRESQTLFVSKYS
ncbi:MAG: GntR family transcriptional regulator [Oceanospirillaceae bacterium]